MTEKINYAWPVTSSSKEEYSVFCEWMTLHKRMLEQNEIAIWGAGIRGTEFSIFFKRNNFTKIFFTDSNEQKWRGYINEFPIVDIDTLKKKMATGRVKILISTENSKEIEDVLIEEGYQKGKDFFSIRSNLYQKYIDEFIRSYKNNVLVMGDCEFSKIALEDTDIRNLGEMIKDELDEAQAKVLAMHGMGLRAHYNLFCMQIAMGMIPKILVIMINLDTLTGKQHLLPRSQHEELLRMVYETVNLSSTEYEEYMKIVHERNKNVQAEFFTTNKYGNRNMPSEGKSKVYFRLNYLYELDVETEGIQYLVKLFQVARDRDIKVIPFIPPVNYQLGEKIFGNGFETRYSKNINKISDIVKNNGLQLLDMSYALKANEFAQPDTPDETANDLGRKKITDILTKKIREEM